MFGDDDEVEEELQSELYRCEAKLQASCCSLMCVCGVSMGVHCVQCAWMWCLAHAACVVLQGYLGASSTKGLSARAATKREQAKLARQERILLASQEVLHWHLYEWCHFLWVGWQEDMHGAE